MTQQFKLDDLLAEVADVIVEETRSATAPLLAEIASLRERLNQLQTKQQASHSTPKANAGLQQAFDEGFEAVKGYIDRSLSAVYDRVEALESRSADTQRRSIRERLATGNARRDPGNEAPERMASGHDG